MDKRKETAMIKQALDEIPRLRKLHYSNTDFRVWKDETLRTLESTYGQESNEYRRFVNSPGKFFVVRTEMGLGEEYNRQLDCYEDVLKSLATTK